MDLRFSKSNNTKHKITLESVLVYAEWTQGVAYAGSGAGVEVGTLFVGEGAPLEIEALTDSGKRLGKLSGKLYQNRFHGVVHIPANAKVGEAIYFEVKCPKNGLHGKSQRIPVLPALRVSNLQWGTDVARRGDWITLSADVQNALDETDAMITIYKHDRDGAHDKVVELRTRIRGEKMKLTWEYQYVDDTAEIPSQTELEQYGVDYHPPEYFFTLKIGEDEYGKQRESGLLRFKDYIEFFARYTDSTPIANTECEVTLPDGSQKQVTTDENGYVRIDHVPPGPYTVHVSEPTGSA